MTFPDLGGSWELLLLTSLVYVSFCGVDTRLRDILSDAGAHE